MALTKLSTDVIDLSDNTEALTIPKGTSISTVGVEYLVVAGGGGGASPIGGAGAGGGGAGGLRTSYPGGSGGGGSSEEKLIALISTPYTVTVGTGGVGGAGVDAAVAGNGGISSFSTITTVGGGGARARDNSSGGPYTGQLTGAGGTYNQYSSSSTNPGLGTTNQGYAGSDSSSGVSIGGGGGGAASAGGATGNGGDALEVSITGVAVAYSGGGGGGSASPSDPVGVGGGAGGVQVGGNGTQANPPSVKCISGQDAPITNTGGGGGGGGRGDTCPSPIAIGGAGSSGVVILRYPTANPITLSSGLYGNLAYATTGACNYPITASALYQLNSDGGTTNNVPDTCGAYNGTAANITYSAGKFGNAADFNGSNTSINIGASNNFASNKLTISFWANPGTGNASNYQMLFSNYIGGSVADYDFIIDRQVDQKLEVGIAGSGSAYLYVLTDSAAFTTGTWKNYVIVFDTTQSANLDKIKIYINGTLVAYSDVASSGTVTGSLLDTSDDLLIGDWPHDTTHIYSGLMDQVRIFPSALTADQVQALYSETTEATTGTIGTETWSKFIAGTGTVSFSGTGTGRPSSPTEGLMRENTTTSKMEFYDGSLWQEITDTASSYSTDLIPSANFNTVLYDGDGGTTQAISGVGFEPNFTWIKDRDDTENHALFDIVRGANEWLHSNNADAQTTYSGNYGLLSWQSDGGFTVGNGTAVNKNNHKYVSWNWKAGGAATTIASGTNGSTVASNVSANTATGFSIVKYTGTLNGAGNIDVAHGLGAAPELIISKRTDSTGSWRVRPFFLNSDPYNYLELDTSGAIANLNSSDGTMAMPTANVFSNNWNSGIGGIGDIIAYCWRSIPGYSKIGFYVGNGSTTGPIIYTGFKPAWLMTKQTTSGYWYILDNKRNTSNPRNTGLFPNDWLAEITNTNYNVDFNNTGFQPKNNTTGFNTLGITYIYMTFAE